MSNKIILAILSLIGLGLAQRPGFAGSRPYGYPVIIATTPPTVSTAAASGNLGDRFGEESAQTTTPPRLPLEANGNTQFVNYLNTLPADQQPFWLLNSQVMEDHRNRPQTWASKQNGYIDIASQGGGSKPELVHNYRSFV